MTTSLSDNFLHTLQRGSIAVLKSMFSIEDLLGQVVDIQEQFDYAMRLHQRAQSDLKMYNYAVETPVHPDGPSGSTGSTGAVYYGQFPLQTPNADDQILELPLIEHLTATVAGSVYPFNVSSFPVEVAINDMNVYLKRLKIKKFIKLKPKDLSVFGVPLFQETDEHLLSAAQELYTSFGPNVIPAFIGPILGNGYYPMKNFIDTNEIVTICTRLFSRDLQVNDSTFRYCYPNFSQEFVDFLTFKEVKHLIYLSSNSPMEYNNLQAFLTSGLWDGTVDGIVYDRAVAIQQRDLKVFFTNLLDELANKVRRLIDVDQIDPSEIMIFFNPNSEATEGIVSAAQYETLRSDNTLNRVRWAGNVWIMGINAISTTLDTLRWGAAVEFTAFSSVNYFYVHPKLQPVFRWEESPETEFDDAYVSYHQNIHLAVQKTEARKIHEWFYTKYTINNTRIYNLYEFYDMAWMVMCAFINQNTNETLKESLLRNSKLYYGVDGWGKFDSNQDIMACHYQYDKVVKIGSDQYTIELERIGHKITGLPMIFYDDMPKNVL